jgi:cytidylate kinase
MTANKQHTSIVLDGPAGVGKSTVAKELARTLKFDYVDTGAMYRVATLLAMEEGIPLDVSQQQKIMDLVAAKPFSFHLTPEGMKIFFGQRDITEAVRSPQVSRNVSVVAAFPAVRQGLTNLQRQYAQEGDVVMDGRDLGTVVIPEATFKFFLTASLDTRAYRRFLELKAMGLKVDLDTLKSELALRDRLDSSRQHAPLAKADDAVVMDTSNSTIDQVLTKIISVINHP